MSKKQLVSEKYESINGLRTLACIGIILMHIKANIEYSLSGSFILTFIDELTNFVFLFMIISSFGMCCGYFDKIKNNEISLEKFYSKRIKKILPFFAFLIIIDIIVEHNIPSIIEGFADVTLLFGFLNKELQVIGVGWFIGLIFIFYLMFPFFTYLFSNKKRAWITTITAILMNLSCIYFFDVGRSNMFFSFIYFCIGGLLYLYRNNIKKLLQKNRFIGLLFIIISLVLYFIIPRSNVYIQLIRIAIVSISLLFYAIAYDSKVLNNKITNFISNISFEMYLCHMVVFRVTEKTKMTRLFNNDWLSYLLLVIIVITGAIVLSFGFKKIYSIIEKKVSKNENLTS